MDKAKFQDLKIMFAGRLCEIYLKDKVRGSNAVDGYLRDYEAPEETLIEELTDIQNDFDKAFASAKRRIIKICDEHPLAEKFSEIRGFTSYQLALIMSHIKDVERFKTPSALCIYAGVGAIKGLGIGITKGKIKMVQDYYKEQGMEFKGFNTVLGGRMFVIVDCLLRAKGYFYDFYMRQKNRLRARCIAGEECEEIEGKLLMKGRKNQSLDIFVHANARRRVARTLLHLIWYEWRKLRGLAVREPYAIEYLGHDSIITLEDILKYELEKSTKKVA